MPTKYADVDGTAVHYVHSGASTLPGVAPDCKRAAPVLFVHDAGGTAGVWQPQVDLCGKNLSPIAFDFPGHGRSGGTESLKSVDAYAAFLVLLLDTLGIAPVVLVGHGMGASVAIETTARAPKKVRGLVLVGAAAKAEISAETLTSWENVMRGRQPQPFTTEQFSPSTDFAVMRQAWMEQAKTDPRVRYFDLIAWSQYDATAQLSNLTLPTVVAVGSDDTITPPTQATILHRGIAGSTLVTIDAAGHMLPLEKPTDLAEAINSVAADA